MDKQARKAIAKAIRELRQAQDAQRILINNAFDTARKDQVRVQAAVKASFQS